MHNHLGLATKTVAGENNAEAAVGNEPGAQGEGACMNEDETVCSAEVGDGNCSSKKKLRGGCQEASDDLIAMACGPMFLCVSYCLLGYANHPEPLLT